MIKKILFILVLSISSHLFGQVTLFYDDLETGAASWTSSGDLTPNFWIANTCAGNGATAAGTQSLYITPGGAIPGCGATGTEQHNYVSAPAAAINSIVSHATIDGVCATSCEVNFDYRIEGNSGSDFAELVYSSDGGTSWVPVGGELAQSATWTNTTIALPALLDGTSFELGFRFTYDDATVTGLPIAVDNILVTGVDDVDPQILCPVPTNLYVDGNCEVALIDYTGSAIISDNCGGSLTVTQSPAAGTIETVENDVIIILTVTDGSGNTATCQFSQPILDTVSPVVNCPVDQTVDGDANCEALVADFTSMGSVVDNCASNFTIIQSPAPGTSINSNTLITLSSEDEYGNTGTCQFNLIITDVIAPLITCPPAVTVGTDVGCDHTLIDYTSLTNVTDNCSATFTYAQSPSAGSLVGLGVTSVTITVTDESGNSANCSFDVTVVDLVNPTITSCPSDQMVSVDVNCEGPLGDYTSLASASDNCSASNNITIAQSPAPGTTITSSTTITITATDEAGNSVDCFFNANIIDDTDPVVTCPSDQILSIDGSCQYTVPDFSGIISGTDNCSTFGNMTVIQSPAIGSTEDAITPVLITLFDEAGNSSTCSFSILPDDTQAPTITCPSPGPEDIGTSCDFIVPNYVSGALVLDNCTNYTITQNPAFGSIINPGLNDITLTVVDAGGNSTSCTFALEVIENSAPTITCPGNVSTCDPLVTYSDPTFNDNCFAYITQTDLTGLSSGSTFPIGTTTLEYTVADSSGNSQTCTFDIEILDFPSQAIIQDDTLYLCDATSTVLNADSPTSGTGEWILVSGTGTFNNEQANTTGVNGLTYGENVIAWVVSSAQCGFTSDTVLVIASQEPLPAVIQDDTIYSCAVDSVLLSANAPIWGTGTWSTNNGAGIDDPNNFETGADIVNSDWQYFYWTVSSGGCPSTMDSIVVFATLDPTINLEDTTVCLENDLLTVSGTDPIDMQVPGWYFISGSGDLSTPDVPTTNVNNFGLGTNWLVYGLDHPICGLVQDTVIIVANLCDGFNPILPTVITPDFDGTNDLFVIDHLEKVYPSCYVVIFNRWGSVVFESTGYEEAWDGNYKGEPLPMGTYFYKIELNDDNNTVLTGDISIIR